MPGFFVLQVRGDGSVPDDVRTKEMGLSLPERVLKPDMVEMRGVEPLSENALKGLSPSAFRDLISPSARPRKD